jgi:hypothetical protein
MDDLDRMYRHLVRTIRATAPQLLTQPFQVGDLYSTILPYRLHRRELGLETNQDYEMAMLELLAGSRGYLAVEDRMRDELGASLRSPNPDPALIRDFAQSRVALAPQALHALEQEGQPATSAATAPPRDPDTAPFRAASSAAAATGPAATAPMGAPSAASSASSAPTAPPAPRTSSANVAASATSGAGQRKQRPAITVSPTGEQCRHCKGELPPGREISFCPHCGQDLTILHCPACGSELEHGWKFCVTCGRTAPGA